MSGPAKLSPGGESYIVSRYGLDGLRQHFMPGNRRRGTGVREKLGFDTEAAARAYVEERHLRIGSFYVCDYCGKWHLASPPRHGDRPIPSEAQVSPLFPAPPGETAGTLDADHGSRPGQPPSKAAA